MIICKDSVRLALSSPYTRYNTPPLDFSNNKLKDPHTKKGQKGQESQKPASQLWFGLVPALFPRDKIEGKDKLSRRDTDLSEAVFVWVRCYPCLLVVAPLVLPLAVHNGSPQFVCILVFFCCCVVFFRSVFEFSFSPTLKQHLTTHILKSTTNIVLG